MSTSMWRIWISRALALIATAGAAVALVGLTTGSWATCTLYGLSTEYGNYQVDRNRHLDLELHPDGRLAVHGDQSLQQLYDDGKNAALREALTHAIPGMLDGFANACVVAIGLLAAVGIFRRLPSYLWTVGCAIAVGGLTAVAVLRFEMLAALATLTAQMHLVQDFQVRGEPLAGRTTAALVAFLVTAAVAAHPLLREPAVAGEPHEHDLPRPVLR